MLRLVAIVLLCGTAFGQRNATEAEIKAKDLTVLPTGAGLPAGHGNAVRGETTSSAQAGVDPVKRPGRQRNGRKHKAYE